MSIKDFDIIQELGKGAFGTVYKVRRIKDNQIYALKKVIMNKLKQKEKENSINEIRILASISHQNIVAYKDAFYDQDLFALCIVTEFADDGDLEKKINENIKKKTHFSETQIFSIFIQILNGLKALHDQKIMHRDIKAANMLLFKDNFVKIGDMNVSKVIKNGLMNTQTGTPYYASPEVWNNKPYDFKSDIWSLGCLLYEMATLKAPFRGNSMKNLFDKVMKGTYDPISGFFSRSLSEIIKSMLMLNPQLRPDCDGILKVICKKISGNFSFNFPIGYEMNDNGQNYFKNFKNELSGNNINYNEQVKLVDNNSGFVNNKKIDVKGENENQENTQNELLQTIKIPKKLNEINSMLPKSNYRKKIISTSVNYDTNARYNDLSFPSVLNKSANENNNNNNLDFSKEININRNASKILSDLRTNYRPISSDNRPKALDNNSINYISNKTNNEGKSNNNSVNSGQNYQRISPKPNNYVDNNFNKRNITHINNPLRNVVNNKNPIIVNQISSKIDKINIVNCNVELLEKLANLNNLNNSSNKNNQENNLNTEQKGNSNSNNNMVNLDLSFNYSHDLAAINQNNITNPIAANKSISSVSPIKSNIGSFYMRKNMDKITSLKVQKSEEQTQNNPFKKLNNLKNLEKKENEVLKTENNIDNLSSEKIHLKKVLDPLSLNLDKNTKLKRIPGKNIDLANLEDWQNSIKQSQNELNMILKKNFINEYIPFNAQSTKNKTRPNLYANRNFIVSDEKNNNNNNNYDSSANQEKQNKINEVSEDAVVYLHTDINCAVKNVNDAENKNIKRIQSAIGPRKNLSNRDAKNKFNNIKIDLEYNNNDFKKEAGLANAYNYDAELYHNQIQTDLEQKSKSSLDREIEENIVSSLSKSSKKVITLNSVKEIQNNRVAYNSSRKSNQEKLIEKTIKTPLNEIDSASNSQKRVNSAITTQHQKNNSNNIKMILNPCHIEETQSLNEINMQKTVEEASNSLHQQQHLEIVNSVSREASELKRLNTSEEKKSNLTAEKLQTENKIKNHQIDYNKIIINNQYNVNNLYNQAPENPDMQVKNRIYSANQKLPASLVEQHNIKAGYLKNQLKLKKNNPFLNSSEKLKNNQDFPSIYNSVNITGSKKNKENVIAYAKFVQIKDKNNKVKLDENNNNINNNNFAKISNSRTPNNFTVKKIDLNLILPLEGREPELNFSAKHNNIPKIITNNRSSAVIGNSNINKTKIKENLKNFSQDKSLFTAKKNPEKSRYSPLLEKANANKENDNSFFPNKEIEFNSSKQNNFEYSFMEKKSKHNSHRKSEMPNITSKNASNNKSSLLMKSEDNSCLIKNVDNIYNAYENYGDGNYNIKEPAALPKIPKYYGSNNNSNNNNANGKKLKINLPSLKKDFGQNANYGLSPVNSSGNNYGTNVKDLIINLSTNNDNLINNPIYNNVNTSSNNRSNFIENNHKYSPINVSLPIANLLSKKTPVNNFSKIKKIVYVNANQ